MRIWSALQSLPGLSSVPAGWGFGLDDDSRRFIDVFLQPGLGTVKSYPCPYNCGCGQRVVAHRDGSIVAVCQCDPPKCQHLSLTLADVIPLDLNLSKFGRALCKALSLESKAVEFGLTCTRQIGSWSASAVPVILTIQWDPQQFRSVVAALVFRLKCPFILLAPTSAHLDAHCQELLAHVGAGFFPLDAYIIITEQGNLQATKPPGEIFLGFAPPPGDSIAESSARQVLALAKRLDAEQPMKLPTAFMVLIMYSQEELSAAEIAQKCRCSKATVISRLNLLHRKLGQHPVTLRRYSEHFKTIEKSLAGARSHDGRPGSTSDDEDTDTEESES